jgi:hypothetical protein
MPQCAAGVARRAGRPGMPQVAAGFAIVVPSRRPGMPQFAAGFTALASRRAPGSQLRVAEQPPRHAAGCRGLAFEIVPRWVAVSGGIGHREGMPQCARGFTPRLLHPSIRQSERACERRLAGPRTLEHRTGVLEWQGVGKGHDRTARDWRREVAGSGEQDTLLSLKLQPMGACYITLHCMDGIMAQKGDTRC